MSTTIRLEKLGPKHFERDIVISTNVDSGNSTVCHISIDSIGVDVYPTELDRIINALTMIRDLV